VSARLFIAVDLPEPVRAEIAGCGRAAAGGGRPVAADALHVTLCFLGLQPTTLVDEIELVLRNRAAPVGRLGLGAPVWLPRRRPRALAIDLRDETGGLTQLADDLGRELEQTTDWERERRTFRPHITVARMRAGAVPPGALPPTPGLSFEPETVTLYRSRLEADGARYEPLARVEL
jgi:2'-5' RNA ligase